jgi:hypothetical protein
MRLISKFLGLSCLKPWLDELTLGLEMSAFPGINLNVPHVSRCLVWVSIFQNMPTQESCCLDFRAVNSPLASLNGFIPNSCSQFLYQRHTWIMGIMCFKKFEL